jgi:citrate lyase subunit beta/citryl-CoA lyase
MTTIRSILFVPADSEKKLAKADPFRPDALVLDLEDSVAPGRKPAARGMAREFLDGRRVGRRSELWVRVNPLPHPGALEDLSAIIGGHPDGVMLPKADGPQDASRLSHFLDALEVRDGVPKGHVKIMLVATETAVAPFRLGA